MSVEIDEIRKLFLNYNDKWPESFHHDDVDRIKRCDWIIERFLQYQIMVNHKTHVNALAKKLIEAMKWRKEQRVNQLKESDFPMEYYQCGGLFICKSNQIK